MCKNLCFVLLALLVLIGFAGLAEAEVVAQAYSSSAPRWGYQYQTPTYGSGTYGGGYYLCCFPYYYPYQQYSQTGSQYLQSPYYGQYSYYGQQYYGQQYQQYSVGYAAYPYYGQQQYYGRQQYYYYCCYSPYPIYRAPY